jgi:hypothetical protein
MEYNTKLHNYISLLFCLQIAATFVRPAPPNVVFIVSPVDGVARATAALVREMGWKQVVMSSALSPTNFLQVIASDFSAYVHVCIFGQIIFKFAGNILLITTSYMGYVHTPRVRVHARVCESARG